MLKLTARQEQILNLIKDAIQNTGFPPTRAEIAAELGFRSTNAAEEHLQALARKGVIEIAAGTSRGIRLLESALSSHIPGIQMALPHPAGDPVSITSPGSMVMLSLTPQIIFSRE